MTKFLTLALATAVCATAVPAFAQSGGSKPSCAAGDPVVWENWRSKVYHMSGDKYYGTTKHGAYACKSAADGAGYHASGSKSSKSSASASDDSSASGAASPDPMASGTTSGKHHHKHHKGMASPAPSPAAT